jgi:hypothetical protein
MNIKITIASLAVIFVSSIAFADGVALMLPPKRAPQASSMVEWRPSAEKQNHIKIHRRHASRHTKKIHHVAEHSSSSGISRAPASLGRPRVVVISENDMTESKPAPVPEDLERAIKDRNDIGNHVDNRFFEIPQ